MIFIDKKNIKLLFYLPLKNEIDNFTQPTIKNKPPKGVTSQMFLGLTPNTDITYNEPEKNKIPKKKNKLMLFLSF